jgi:8-oxo-dGTP pyrophosphatase MutT (NUDIX family)
VTGAGPEPAEPAAPRWPVSVKGVILERDRVVLLRNDRGEWELPGGRLESDEELETCLVREIREELGVAVEVGPLLDAWLYRPADHTVVVLTFGCRCPSTDGMRHSAEHDEHAWLPVGDLANEPLPVGYRRAIERWCAQSPSAQLPSAQSPSA